MKVNFGNSNYFNKIIVTLVTQGSHSSFLSRPVPEARYSVHVCTNEKVSKQGKG